MNTYKFIFALLITLNFSCKKFVVIEPAPGIIESERIFNDQESVLQAMMGVYTNMRTWNLHFSNAGMHILAGLSADELMTTTTLANYEEFKNNNLSPTSTILHNNYWIAAYKNIYRINAVIGGLNKSTGITENFKKQCRAEMLFNRAWHYLYLINSFGDVPLITTTQYQVNATMPRAAVNLIYEQIITDLKEAKETLPDIYPSPGKARPNKHTATALLSRVYLYTEKWSAAEAEADTIINSGIYNLVNELNKVFLINSAETIWEVASNNENGNTGQTGIFLPVSATAPPALSLTPALINAFENNDNRKADWTNSNGQYLYPFKYRNKSASPVMEYNVMIRLAEIFLIRAEAKAHQNKLTGSCADLNIIRSRANLPLFNSTIKEQVLLAIEKERRVELFTEWGHRWFDLKRTGQADSVLSALKGNNWQSTDKKYPIPQTELDNNPFLIQNDGY